MLKSLAPPDPKKMMSFFLENMRSTLKRIVAFANLLPGCVDSFIISLKLGGVLQKVAEGGAMLGAGNDCPWQNLKLGRHPQIRAQRVLFL